MTTVGFDVPSITVFVYPEIPFPPKTGTGFISDEFFGRSETRIPLPLVNLAMSPTFSLDTPSIESNRVSIERRSIGSVSENVFTIFC